VGQLRSELVWSGSVSDSQSLPASRGRRQKPPCSKRRHEVRIHQGQSINSSRTCQAKFGGPERALQPCLWSNASIDNLGTSYHEYKPMAACLIPVPESYCSLFQVVSFRHLAAETRRTPPLQTLQLCKRSSGPTLTSSKQSYFG
jgi:hypothetical protein